MIYLFNPPIVWYPRKNCLSFNQGIICVFVDALFGIYPILMDEDRNFWLAVIFDKTLPLVIEGLKSTIEMTNINNPGQ